MLYILFKTFYKKKGYLQTQIMRKLYHLIVLVLIVCAGFWFWNSSYRTQLTDYFQDTESFTQGIQQLFSKDNQIAEIVKEEQLVQVDTNTAFYYNQLSAEEQMVYQEILTGINQRQNRIGVEALSNEALSNVLEYVLNDHPEFFWLSGNSTIWSNQSDTRKDIELEYTIAIDQIDGIKAEIDSIIDHYMASWSSEAGEYDKVKAVYDYVILNTDYNLQAENNQNIQSVFLTQQSVCAGYAKAIQYMLQKAGVFCTYVSGTINSSGEYHAWNLVSINGAYYYVDATWGDPTFLQNEASEDNKDTISYDYLCFTTSELLRTHTPKLPQILPDCASNEYDYYRLHGWFYSEYIESAIVETLSNDVENGVSESYLKFTTAESYSEAYTRLFTDNVVYIPAKIKAEQTGSDTYGCTYWSNEEFYIIKILW